MNMKRILAMILICVLLLSGCGGKKTKKTFGDKESSRSDRGDAVMEGVSAQRPASGEDDEMAADQAGLGGWSDMAGLDTDSVVSEMPIEPAPATRVEVLFEHHCGAEEYAVIRGITESGDTLWESFTASYPAAQMDMITPIGQYDDRYYYVEGGAVVALSVSDGSMLWRNDGFGGALGDDCCVLGEDGTVYLSGFWGPDLFVVDRNGNTCKRVETVNADYFGAAYLEIRDGQAIIYMSSGPDGDLGGDLMPVYVDLP